MSAAIQPLPSGDAETERDARAHAAEAGLHYGSDARPGIRRRRRGKGFAYRRDDGEEVTPAHRQRIDALAIPPAWTDVWIATDPRSHLQATGRDARGRKQYRYHPRWRAHRDADKFSQLASFGEALADARPLLADALSSPTLSRERVLAAVVTMLDETLIRVGNVQYAEENETYGLTTIGPDHVELASNHFDLSFVGKSGIEHIARVDNPRIVRVVRRCHELGGQHLFSYASPDGEPIAVGSSDVNEHLRRLLGMDVTAKAFRTWGGTVAVAERLATGRSEEEVDDDRAAANVERLVLDAIDGAAAQLGNTRAVCRSSYVHPQIVDAFREGALADAWRSSRASRWQSRTERAVLQVLRT